MGERGMIDMDAYARLQLANNGVWQTVAQQPPVNPEQANTAFQLPRMQAYIDQLAAYTDATLKGAPPPVSGEDGRIGVAVALAFLESSRTGKVVQL
jgi:predicted dehydrogenase